MLPLPTLTCNLTPALRWMYTPQATSSLYICVKIQHRPLMRSGSSLPRSRTTREHTTTGNFNDTICSTQSCARQPTRCCCSRGLSAAGCCSLCSVVVATGGDGAIWRLCAGCGAGAVAVLQARPNAHCRPCCCCYSLTAILDRSICRSATFAVQHSRSCCRCRSCCYSSSCCYGCCAAGLFV
jgi:hypothetical protein